MTGISPLQDIHKKGVYGDHHKKNENELISIAELKNLSIIQIVQYKNAKIDINNLNIDDLKIPLQNSKVSCNKNTRILWVGPNTWVVVSKNADILKFINKKCNSENFAITDISQSRAVIQIKGIQTKEVLKKGCPINFNEFEKNNCAGSVFHGINILVDCIDNDMQIFNILTLRSFGESFYHHLTDATLEFGYISI